MNEKKLASYVMKEIGQVIKDTEIEGDYWGREETWKPDLVRTIRSLGARIISRAEEIGT